MVCSKCQFVRDISYRKQKRKQKTLFHKNDNYTESDLKVQSHLFPKEDKSQTLLSPNPLK